MGKRAAGFLISIASMLLLMYLSENLTVRGRGHAIVFAVPAVFLAAGVFQFLVGISLLELNSKSETMSLGKKTSLILLQLLILVMVLVGFSFYIYS